ncbi:MAG: MMPL family transporter [Streptosporangiaceae bacterium]|nr:MMPL family transporter [Streptosporangiaceae bacterium]MBV9853845.1 MMPL family transporter [Streptosporangiaceae bacterium]
MTTTQPTRAPFVERVAGWSVRHKKTAVFGWLLLVVAAIMVGQRLGTSNLSSYDPGQAGQAERVLDRPGVQKMQSESVLIQSRAPGRTFGNDPEIRQAVRQVVAGLKGVPASAEDVRSPFGRGGAGLLSGGGQSALVTFDVAGDSGTANKAVVPAMNAVAAVQARHPALKVEEAGGASVDRAIGSTTSRDFRKAEVTSVPISLALLLLVFGALVAAGIPLLLAGTAVISAISLLAIPSRWLPVDSTTSSIVLLVGMAVGIDYSLFYLRRVREERVAGRTPGEALRVATATSGRAILVSGLTVMISLAGLFITGIDVFSGVAIGTIIVVGVAVLGSLTFLPALLALLGRGVDKGRIPFLGRRRTAARGSRLWSVTVRAVVRRPLVLGGLAAAALVAVALPVFGMNLENPGIHDLPTNVPVVRTLLDIQRAFPGGPSPAEVVVTGQDLSSPRVAAAVSALHGEVAATHGAIREPISTTMLGNGQVLLISVPLAGAGTDAASNHALATLRTQALPATLGGVPGISYAVGGQTAGSHDFDAQLAARTPLVFVFVLGLAFLLLMTTFRSVAIPALSICLNLLSVGAAYGLMILIFQDGHLQSTLGFTSYGGIVTWMPLFMFVLLFGLSMDYHVFILSRIRELRLRGASTRQAITDGIGHSAGVVTSAAAIMVAVFSIFASLSLIEFKMFGIGMAAAVLIDATVVRGILLPAGLALLGDRTWYLPRWLGGGGRHARHEIPEDRRYPAAVGS